MSLTILRSLRVRILALVLGLIALLLTAAIVGTALEARAEVEGQVGVELRSAADTADLRRDRRLRFMTDAAFSNLIGRHFGAVIL
jgi:hypothetical protein